MRLAYLSAGIIGFLVTLLFTLPPQRALDWLADDLLVDIQLHAPQGSAAYGVANAVSVDSLVLEQTRWRLLPWMLFTGRLGYRINSAIEQQSVVGQVAFGFGGDVTISALEATLPIAVIRPMIKGLLIPADGVVVAKLDTLTIEAEQVTDMAGIVELRELQLSFLRPSLPLGSFVAELNGTDEGISASISSPAGSPLESQGTLELLSDHRYRLSLQLRPRDHADARLVKMLSGFSPADGQGWHRLNQQGSL